jgi:hypothetical protein
MQTNKQSAIEVLAGTLIGFLITFAAQLFIMELYALPSTLTQDLAITGFFTGISILRGYAVRRFFNWLWRPKHG